MDQIDFRNIGCPYCGETIELMVDRSGGAQAYIEDCSVCCRPIEILVGYDGDDDWRLEVRRDDE